MASTARPCRTPGCNKASTLRCPDCMKLGNVWSAYCSKECFSKCWKVHKKFHTVLINCPALLAILNQDEKDTLEDEVNNGVDPKGKYIGELNDKGQKHGIGVYCYYSGDAYVGEFVNGVLQGQGRLTMSDGDFYRGSFQSDLFQGEGVYTFANGDQYIGSFDKDFFHGYGVCVKSDGSRYEGQYEKGKQSGHGVQRQIDGKIFDGQFANDKRVHGTLTGSGERYTGEFENDLPHGKGKLVKANGKEQSGYFERGVFVGKKKPEKPDSHRRIKIRDLVEWQVHSGCYIEGTVTGDLFRMNAVTFTMQDEPGSAMTIAIYNYPGYGGAFNISQNPNFTNCCGIKQGMKVRINDPFCKIAMDGRICVRVEDWNDVVFEGKSSV